MRARTAEHLRASENEHLRRLNALLQEALALTQGMRAGWLAALPEHDQPLAPALRQLVARMAAPADGFMRRPARMVLQGGSDAPADARGDRIGPYRLLRELGRGGMACVWLAERRDGAMVRQVALKLPKGGWAVGRASCIAHERDILASLTHPLIVRLYESGVTPQGRPWLAMERVHGVPIDAYCRVERLGVHARLLLFLQVADAVAHAHARRVVHRDLKPGNILVTPQGEVRLLDFGVSSALGDSAQDPGALPPTLARAATPGYAAPEQLEGRPAAVANDVYALGVVLYELLTGARPYRLAHDSAPAVEVPLHTAEAPPASQSAAPDACLARLLRGDIDAILARALRQQPAQRYASVPSMASDLRRHLRGEPVHAQPPDRSDRPARFA